MDSSSLPKKIGEYIRSRATARLEKLDKEASKNPELATQRTEEEAKFYPATWLTDAASRAKQISMVTHALKYTHTDAKGTSILAANDGSRGKPYLTTAALTDPATDVVGNAAALDVAGLLLLKDEDGQTFANKLAQDDVSALKPFAENDEQLQEWLSGFKAALADRELSSHKLAKQVYFPMGDEEYHLIGPLFGSSLAQAVYDRVTRSRFSEEAKAARKARREGKYSETATIDYPGTAVQSFGGTKPQNVSQLNTSRRGKSILLNCSPPSWKSRDLPAMNTEGAFWRHWSRRRNVWQTANQLGDFLIDVADKNNKKIRLYRETLVEELMEDLLLYAAEIQSLHHHAGWSAKSALPREEQLWLDPLREDDAFQDERDRGDWKPEIAERFGAWLNDRLRRKKLDVKDTEYQEWKTTFDKKLSLFKESLEVMA